MNLEMILATKSSTPIIGQLATVMGWIMDGIYRLLNVFGIQNIGLCIIIFSILIYALMTPLQVKQQKFSKLSAIMQPELQKIQKKYKGKNNDSAAMQKMQEEIAQMEVTGESGAGLVKVTINGAHNCRRVEIDPSLLEDDKDMLEDLVAAAFNDAARRIDETQKEKMASVSSGMQLPPGFKMPF